MELSDFCKIIETSFSPSKYKNWYISLVLKTLQRVNFDKPNFKKQAKKFIPFIERHHICPISLFPEFSKEPKNLSYLSPKEHFVAHLLLFKMCRIDNKWIIPMAHALSMMKRCNKQQKRILNSNEYSFIRLATSLARKGVPRTNEMKIKLSKARKGKYTGKENGMFGVKHSEESKIKMRINSLKPYLKNLSYNLTISNWDDFVSDIIKYTQEKNNPAETMRQFGIGDITIRKFFKEKGLICPNGNEVKIMPKRTNYSFPNPMLGKKHSIKTREKMKEIWRKRKLKKQGLTLNS
jgi:hypothetical protein